MRLPQCKWCSEPADGVGDECAKCMSVVEWLDNRDAASDTYTDDIINTLEEQFEDR